MQDKLNDIRQAVRQRLDKASQSSHIEELRVSVLGRKGELTALLKGMNLEKGATAIERNGKIGGHNA